MAHAFTQPDTGPHPVQHPAVADITTVIRRAADHAPRSLQIALGPSEIGMTCQRQLAYKILDWPRINHDSDPWAAIIGTAVHAWLADAFTQANTYLGYTRWLVEATLEIRSGIEGHCDLYDLDNRRCLDHKVLGNTTYNELKRHGPSDQYRKQIHLYGLGWDNLGLTPDTVAIAAYPRSGFLTGLHIWEEPYNRDIALAALDSYDNLVLTLDVLDVDHNPQLFEVITPSPGHHCRYCPWWSARAKNPTEGCRGDLQ